MRRTTEKVSPWELNFIFSRIVSFILHCTETEKAPWFFEFSLTRIGIVEVKNINKKIIYRSSEKMVKCSFLNFNSIISLSSTDFRLIRFHRLQLYVKRSGFKMLYELVTVYDNRLQSLKSQIKLNEAVFGKRQGKTWMEENNYIKHPYTTQMLCIAGQRTILGKAFAVKTFSRQRLYWLSRKQHKCVGNN